MPSFLEILVGLSSFEHDTTILLRLQISTNAMIIWQNFIILIIIYVNSQCKDTKNSSNLQIILKIIGDKDNLHYIDMSL